MHSSSLQALTFQSQVFSERTHFNDKYQTSSSLIISYTFYICSLRARVLLFVSFGLIVFLSFLSSFLWFLHWNIGSKSLRGLGSVSSERLVWCDITWPKIVSVSCAVRDWVGAVTPDQKLRQPFVLQEIGLVLQHLIKNWATIFWAVKNRVGETSSWSKIVYCTLLVLLVKALVGFGKKAGRRLL